MRAARVWGKGSFSPPSCGRPLKAATRRRVLYQASWAGTALVAASESFCPSSCFCLQSAQSQAMSPSTSRNGRAVKLV